MCDCMATQGRDLPITVEADEGFQSAGFIVMIHIIDPHIPDMSNSVSSSIFRLRRFSLMDGTEFGISLSSNSYILIHDSYEDCHQRRCQNRNRKRR
jgi:hypothetical protein